MTDLSNVLRSYSLSVSRPNTGEKRALIIKQLHDHYNELNHCVLSRQTSIVVSYRGKIFNLVEFADFFKAPPILVLAIYDTHGGDIDSMFHFMGRKLINHLNKSVDKVELGNRYCIPWRLVDEHEADPKLYAELLRLYTHFDRKRGEIGNPKVGSGSIAFSQEKRNIKDYERLLKQATLRVYGDGKPKTYTRKTEKPFSVAQAKLIQPRQ